VIPQCNLCLYLKLNLGCEGGGRANRSSLFSATLLQERSDHTPFGAISLFGRYLFECQCCRNTRSSAAECMLLALIRRRKPLHGLGSGPFTLLRRTVVVGVVLGQFSVLKKAGRTSAARTSAAPTPRANAARRLRLLCVPSPDQQ